MKDLFSKRNKAFLRQLVLTEFKIRYQGSFLGYIWSLIKPLLLFIVLYFVFTQIFRFGDDFENFETYLLLGIVLWTFFVEATVGGQGSIVGRGDMIRKVSVPKFAVVLSMSISALINLLLNLVVVFIFIFFTGVDIGPRIVFLPLFLIELFILATICSYILGTLYVKFRDISYIWEVVLQMLFYATPIIYPLMIIENVFTQKLLLLNPLAHIIQGAREVTITQQTTTGYELMGYIGDIVPLVIIVVAGAFAYWLFNKESPDFAEYL